MKRTDFLANLIMNKGADHSEEIEKSMKTIFHPEFKKKHSKIADPIDKIIHG